MTPVIPFTTSNISFIPGTAFTTKGSNRLSNGSLLRKSVNHTSSSQRFLSPLSASVRLFPQYRRDFSLFRRSLVHMVSATGTDVAVEEPDSPVVDEDSGGASETLADAVETSEKSVASPAPAQSRRSRSSRKSEMPPVKDEDLVPGATFTGKVRSIQPFGAFVDFGAFTDGLVHVSRLSDSFVKDVGNIVSVGQEVKVRLVEANTETGRISLTMRESDDINKLQQRKDSPAIAGSDKPRSARKNASKPSPKKEGIKSSKFVKGQDLEGTVKNLTRSGAFISLPEGEEGFLPTSEESDGGFGSMMGGSSLQVGQDVSVRVLRITRGQVTLTMKKEENNVTSDMELVQGVVHVATNPFVVAFRKSKDIAAFLDEREKLEKAANEQAVPKTAVEKGGPVGQTEIVSNVTEVEEQPLCNDEGLITVSSTVGKTVEDDETDAKEVAVGTIAANDDKKSEIRESSSSQSVEGVVQTIEKEAEGSVSTAEQIIEEAPANDGVGNNGKPDSPKTAVEKGRLVGQTETVSDVVEVEEQPLSSDEGTIAVSSTVDETVEDDETEAKEVAVGATAANDDKKPEIIEYSSSQSVEVAVQTIEKEAEGSVSTAEQIIEEAPTTDGMENDGKLDSPKTAVEKEGPIGQIETVSDAAEVEEQPLSSDEGLIAVSSIVDETVEDGETDPKEVAVVAIVANDDNKPEIMESSSSQSVEGAVQTIEKEAEGSVSTAEQIIEEASPTDGVEKDGKPDSSVETASLVSSLGSPIIEEVVESQLDDTTAKDEAQIQASTAENEILSTAPVEDGVATTSDENGSITGSDEMESVESSDPSGDAGEAEILSSASQAVEDVVENQESIKDEVQIQTPAAETEILSASQVEDEKVEPAPEENCLIVNSNGQSGSPSKENVTKATISPALVKQLREETGAGMMDCKKALSETGGDIVKAQEFLRKKGLASAEKKASRATAEGRIGSYIHDSRIGVLVEVNCETDFVSRGDIFKELVGDLAMQVAACPQVQYLVTDDVPKEIVNKEKEIEMQKEDLLSKPEQIRAKIVEGRIRKRLEELALLEQPYIKNDKVVVKDWVKQTIATIGENIKVKRFVRYNLGEGLEKKSQDFAAEVASQTAAKPVAAPVKGQPAEAEANESAQKPAVTVSAALVKQLREETGAGMMDCKRALSETGGDLEKAQEYLRKKGLSTADKKSNRLAAEGRIGAYIHDSRIGVLIEVNCETDFVGRSEIFRELVDNLAMQVVGCPQVEFVSTEDISEGIVKKEKELEMQREDLLSKPENIRERIVEGRVSKRLGECALLEQPFIKDDSILVKDLVKQTVAALGENIKVRRFVRFTLGETNEDTKTETTE